MAIVIFIVAFFFGLFAFSQIIYPLFSALPKAKKLERMGKLKMPIPIYTFIVPVIIWSILLTGLTLLCLKYFPQYISIYTISLIIVLIVVIIQIPKQNKDLEEDFKDTWKKYLREE